MTRLLRDAWRVQRDTLHDAAWYRARHGGGFWPALHYLRRGAAMGCQPGPGFDGDAYLHAHAEADFSDRNPLLHYLEEGRDKGLSIFPVAPGPWRRPARLALPVADAAGKLRAPPGTRLSILIPTRDRAGLLRRCIRDVLRHPCALSIEVIVIDNDSGACARRLLRRLAGHPQIRVLAHPGPFNWSAMNNRAAALARGEVLLLLNNDTCAPSPGALEELVALALQPGVGAVGPTLLYPNGTIQHAGIALGRRAASAHLFRHAPGNLPLARREVGALTGACLAVRRELFLAVGGMEETHLPITHSDVDFCLRLRAAGHAILHTPHARLTHAEGATRGMDSTPAHRDRLAGERRFLVRRWGEAASVDPTLPVGTRIIGGFPCAVLDAPCPAKQPARASPRDQAANDGTSRPAFF